METSSGASHSSAGGYEFTAAQNDIIRSAGSRTKIWGILTLCVGVLMALGGLLAMFSGEAFGVVAGLIYGLLALITIFIGLNFVRAGNALGEVVTTEGNDISHLMDSLHNLGRAFLIQIVAAVVWLVILMLGILAAIAVPAFMARG